MSACCRSGVSAVLVVRVATPVAPGVPVVSRAAAGCSSVTAVPVARADPRHRPPVTEAPVVAAAARDCYRCWATVVPAAQAAMAVRPEALALPAVGVHH